MSIQFFLASCEVCESLGSCSLDWEELTSDGGVQRQRSYEHQPLRSVHIHDLPLLNAMGQPIHIYGFYHRLRTHEAWRVPVFYGKLPRVPHGDAPAAERGFYATFLMLLFRPHRVLEDIVRVARQSVHDDLSEDDAWILMESEYLRWRKFDVSAKAAKYKSAQPEVSDFFFGRLVGQSD